VPRRMRRAWVRRRSPGRGGSGALELEPSATTTSPAQSNSSPTSPTTICSVTT
jgi:hypothetical protein